MALQRILDFPHQVTHKLYCQWSNERTNGHSNCDRIDWAEVRPNGWPSLIAVANARPKHPTVVLPQARLGCEGFGSVADLRLGNEGMTPHYRFLGDRPLKE